MSPHRPFSTKMDTWLFVEQVPGSSPGWHHIEHTSCFVRCPTRIGVIGCIWYTSTRLQALCMSPLSTTSTTISLSLMKVGLANTCMAVVLYYEPQVTRIHQGVKPRLYIYMYLVCIPSLVHMILSVFQLALVSCPHPEEEHARKDPTYTLRMLNPETHATLEALQEEEKAKKIVSHGKGELQLPYIIDCTHNTLRRRKSARGRWRPPRGMLWVGSW